MVRHVVDMEKCKGCGKCVDFCSLELFEFFEFEDGKQRARAVDEAKEVCNMCQTCQDACPEGAITVFEEE